MIDVFVIRRFYGTEGEQNNETAKGGRVEERRRGEGNEISQERAAPVFMKPKAQ